MLDGDSLFPSLLEMCPSYTQIEGHTFALSIGEVHAKLRKGWDGWDGWGGWDGWDGWDGW